MNPLTNVRNVQKLNERELELGMIGKKSWHDDYKDSAWIFIGGLPYDLSEGDIICVFSQYGEVVNFNLIRDHKTGKSKGFAFMCYEDQRSTVLSVDNLNGIKILGRTIRVDHVKDYKVPKDHEEDDQIIRMMREEGCAPQVQDEPEDKIKEEFEQKDEAGKKKKKKKDVKKKKKKKRHSSSESSHSEDDGNLQVKDEPMEVKREKEDKGYDKALVPSRNASRQGENGHDSKYPKDESNKRRRDEDDRGRDQRRERYRDNEERDRERRRMDEGRRTDRENDDGQRERDHERRNRDESRKAGRENGFDGQRDRDIERRKRDESRGDKDRHHSFDRDRERPRKRSRSGSRESERRGDRGRYK